MDTAIITRATPMEFIIERNMALYEAHTMGLISENEIPKDNFDEVIYKQVLMQMSLPEGPVMTVPASCFRTLLASTAKHELQTWEDADIEKFMNDITTQSDWIKTMMALGQIDFEKKPEESREAINSNPIVGTLSERWKKVLDKAKIDAEFIIYCKNGRQYDMGIWRVVCNIAAQRN